MFSCFYLLVFLLQTTTNWKSKDGDIFIDNDEGIEGSGGDRELKNDLEASGSGAGPDDEDTVPDRTFISFLFNHIHKNKIIFYLLLIGSSYTFSLGATTVDPPTQSNAPIIIIIISIFISLVVCVGVFGGCCSRQMVDWSCYDKSHAP